MTECSSCNCTFRTYQALHAHCRDKRDHAYCVDCERLFATFHGLNQHLQNSAVHKDDSYSEASSWEESEVSDEEPPNRCEACSRDFIDNRSLVQHLATSLKHNWCFECSRDFRSASALDQHASSQAHRARNMSCPLCPKTFKVPSAIALHIESGACHNITRHQVTAAIHSLQVVPTISISRRIQGPSASTGTTVHYSASERAFNGTAYECYICHRTFNTLTSLNSHLGSPTHDANEFKCPKCKRHYQLISGLIQHIETEVCGVARFQQVEQFANDLTGQFARLLKL